MNFGLDVGTKNVVLSYRDQSGKIKRRHEINGFCKLNNGDGLSKQLLTQNGIPFIECKDNLIALGARAEELSYAFNQPLQRPMADGVVNGDEDEAINIMSTIIRSLLLGVIGGDSTVHYCVPAKALNAELNVAFHQKVVQMIVDSVSSKGVKLDAVAINEARALAFSQIPDKTAIAVSFGAGMVNACYSLFGLPVFEFSLVGSGDWIDRETARVIKGETMTSTCRYKENKLKNRKFTLKKMPEDNVGKALYINYGILIENVVRGLVDGFIQNEDKARLERPMPIILGGGTAMVDGFQDRFQEVINDLEVPFQVGEIKMADPMLYAVADGCLVASELHKG